MHHIKSLTAILRIFQFLSHILDAIFISGASVSLEHIFHLLFLVFSAIFLGVANLINVISGFPAIDV